MVDQRLVNYIKSELLRGTSLNQIRQILLSRGWSDYDINKATDLAIRQIISLATTKPTTYKEPAKKSSKLWIIPVVIILIIGGFFCFFMLTRGTQEPKAPSGPIDCGSDMDCFIQASQNCTPAKVIYTVTTNFFGVKQTTTTYFEIKGLEADKCILYLRTEKINLTFPPGTPQNIVDQQKDLYKKFEGRYASCKFNTSYLVAMLNKWKEGSFESGASCTLVGNKWKCNYSGDWKKLAENCQGTYFSEEL